MSQGEAEGGRRGRAPGRRAVALSALLVAGLAAACGGDGDGADGAAGTATGASVTGPDGGEGTVATDDAGSTPAATDPPTTDTPVTGDTPDTTGPAPALVGDPVAVDPAWTPFEETWFVWGVEDDDVLNARADAGAEARLVATFDPGADGIVVFAEAKPVGEEIWRPVQVAEGAAWVNARYLRPEGPATPEVQGRAEGGVAEAAAAVVEALRTLDLPALAALTHPDGMRVSPYAYVSDQSVLLTPAAITGAATASEELLWGYTDGEGAPIRRTVLDQLRAVAGGTALTSTSVVGYGPRVRDSNSIDNIDEVFPGAARVEYHFAGTSLYGDFDWTSVRLVFDTGGPEPRLVALVEDGWTI